MNKAYLGIDPGSKGAMALYCDGEWKHWFYSDYTTAQLADVFYEIKSKHPHIHAVLEDVKCIHGSAATATFNFGIIKGINIALLCATHIPYTLITPQKWQKLIWTEKDKIYIYSKDLDKTGQCKKKVNTKQTSINCAIRLFPDTDFRKSERCRNVDDNLVDAYLMAEYARRTNL